MMATGNIGVGHQSSRMGVAKSISQINTYVESNKYRLYRMALPENAGGLSEVGTFYCLRTSNSSSLQGIKRLDTRHRGHHGAGDGDTGHWRRSSRIGCCHCRAEKRI